MKDDNYLCDVKEKDGNVTVEKVSKEENVKEEDTSKNFEDIKKKNWKPVFILLPILVIVPLLVLFFLSLQEDNMNHEEKYRTFMIYMVGSDLESSGSIATYDLNDIKGSKIDLENNNVVLMVGGSKKWHNFVNEDEIGIYKLSKKGFSKIKSYSVSSMGSVDTFSNFLDYVYSSFPSEKYDLIFWNHGLGAAGLEVDELSDDFLDINELNTVFKESPFAKEKLELVIFNNCLSANIHFASVMKNYAEYMVASEEVLYVGSVIDRLNFLNDVKEKDSAYDIGLLYVNKSDASIDAVNKSGKMSLDSTMSIIDLSKIDDVETSMNIFFNSLDLDNDYRAISRKRRSTDTYGQGDYEYDTVDLYDLSNSLQSYSNDKAVESLQSSIKEAVKYNSALNDYSNGLSVYFPYYGSEEHIETHLYLMGKIWDNDYTSFINSFYNRANSAKRAHRAGQETVLYLANDLKRENDSITVLLTDKEFDEYQSANIYVFKKENDKYELVLKSDKVSLNDKQLVFNNSNVLKADNKIVSSIYEKNTYKVYGNYNDTDVILKISNDGLINGLFVDSDDKPIGGFVEYNDDNIDFYSISYSSLTEEKIEEDWETLKEKKTLNNESINLSVEKLDLKDYYVLIEMKDENNDTYYSKLTRIY